MSDEQEPRRSRRAWPKPLDMQEIRSRQPARQRLVPWVIVYSAIGLLTVCVAVIFVYILSRGHERDVQNRETQQQTRELIRQGMCDLLDQLPASAVLDGPRHKYGCGPGIPVSQLPPAVRQRLTPPASPSAARATRAAPTSAVPSKTSLSGATAARTVAPDQPVGTRPPDAPARTTPPPDPLLCGLVPHVCLEIP